MFTKQHYEKIAAVLDSQRPYGRYIYLYPWKTIVDSFCTMLREDNPNFNGEKFLIACGCLKLFTTEE